ncbi:MAG: hypothetical protein OXI43_04660 [Candidatus Poribacteria bacterium]|nr:hypothetical protein [Candidatus Poribacteria bacterium]
MTENRTADINPGDDTASAFELTIDGESRTLKKGDTYIIPSHVKHSAKAFDKMAIALDIFSPPREDYIS